MLDEAKLQIYMKTLERENIQEEILSAHFGWYRTKKKEIHFPTRFTLYQEFRHDFREHAFCIPTQISLKEWERELTGRNATTEEASLIKRNRRIGIINLSQISNINHSVLAKA